MKHLIEMKKRLVECVEEQMEDLHCVDTKELGEAIDMIKDLEEAIYYCTMAHCKHKEETVKYCCTCGGLKSGSYETKEHMPMEYSEKMPMEHEAMPMMEEEDEKIGHSFKKRKAYLEAREKNKDKIVQMKELEEYMKELSADVTEMIKDASPEERQLLEKRIQSLATKISQIS